MASVLGNPKIENRTISANDPFAYMMPCPLCNRRVFDLSEMSGNLVCIRLKCPHCRMIVQIPIHRPSVSEETA